MRNEIFKAKAEKSWNLISKWNGLRKVICGLNAGFMNLMMLNGGSAILLWAGMAVYDIDLWLITEWVMGHIADYELWI